MPELKEMEAAKGRLRTTYLAVLIPLGTAINLVGGQVASQLKLPLFLDSIGTAIVAAIMGPWAGAASGVLYNVIASLISGNLARLAVRDLQHGDGPYRRLHGAKGQVRDVGARGPGGRVRRAGQCHARRAHRGSGVRRRAGQRRRFAGSRVAVAGAGHLVRGV